MFKVAAVVLDDQTRVELEARARSTTMPVRDVQRARIILLCAEGVSIRQIARPGRHRRREFEYGRHGTASLFAAMDVHSGQVLAQPIDVKNDSINFCGFLTEIDRVVDPDLEIHVVLDNGSSHRSKHTTAWFEDHPRWVAHFTPPHASWVNQVELFFSILQRKVIRGGRFDSRDELITKMLKFIADYDQTARPFKWTYAADPLKAA